MAKPAASYKPADAHTLNAYLTVNDAAKAIDFYTRAFGAREMNRMPGPKGEIMHAALLIGDSTLYLSDELMGARGPIALGGTPVTLHMYVPDPDAVWNQATGAGAKVVVPLEDTFWGDRYGVVADPFGHQWAISAQKLELTREEIMERGKAAMSRM